MKILCLGDSPFLSTGFGVVNKVATDHLLSLGHELIILGAQDTLERRRPGVTFIPIDEGTIERLGWSKVEKIIDDYQPDAAHIIADAATVCVWRAVPKLAALPTFAYVPIEGEPMNFEWAKVFDSAKNMRIATCSYFGQRVLAENNIRSAMAYHGVSDDFKPISPERRAELRTRLSWDDKIVVMCVAQNVGRKQWPRLFEAIKIVRKRNPNVILYAHTVPFQNYWLKGHHLSRLADEMGIWDYVVFPPSLAKYNDFSPLHGSEDKLGLVDMYGVADMFVLPSQVEGFGLPLAEAMACGLPVITTNYAAQAEVVGKAGVLIDPRDWTINSCHARYAHLDPKDIATEIERLARNPELRKTYSRRGIERAKDFTWDEYRRLLTGAFGAAEERHDTTEGVDQGLQAVG